MFSDMSSYLQITISLAFVLILFLIAYLVFNYEKLNFRDWQKKINVQREVVLFDGIVDFATTQTSFDTYNKTLANYKELTPSVNQKGGAEYSYNFWIYMDKDQLNKITPMPSDIVLLLRGSTSRVPYNDNANCQIVNTGTYILVKNPLIRMKSDGSALIVEYNTITNPDSFHELGSDEIDCTSTEWNDNNKGLLGVYNLGNYVYNKKWFMLTIVLKELSPENDIFYKNRTSCKIFINSLNILDRVVESPYGTDYGSAVMKHNRGPLYVNPGDIFSSDGHYNQNPVKDMPQAISMANLHYYNYALTEDEIADLFKHRFKKEPAKLNVSITGEDYIIAPINENQNTFPIGF